MKKYTLLLLLLLLAIPLQAQKPRLLVTTDIGGDPDDQQSLIRLMVYTNQFDMEGIISSSAGIPGELKKETIRPDLINEIIQGYESVYPNLLKHDQGYPSPKHLFSVVKRGNPSRGWQNVGEGKDTEGSEWIIRMGDKRDKRPLNICIFGGQTDLAQALWKVKNTRSPRKYKKFISRLRIYDINDQDKIFRQIWAEHPGLFYILAKAPDGTDKREGGYRGVYLGGDESVTSREWITENVKENHGPLGSLYPMKTWTAPNPHGVMKEGDTPSWFFFLNNGLSVPEKPEMGGWGGRFLKNSEEYYSDAVDSFMNKKNARATVFRWRNDFQNDWAARMDWCIKEYSEANHAPVIKVNGSESGVLTVSGKSGSQITLDASGSSDPDGNNLLYDWLFYPDDGSAGRNARIEQHGSRAVVTIPEGEKNIRIYLVLRVTDNGIPALTRYKRIVVEVK